MIVKNFDLIIHLKTSKKEEDSFEKVLVDFILDCNQVEAKDKLSFDELANVSFYFPVCHPK